MELISKSDLDDFSKLNVLIIDDNLLVHDLLKETLYDLGIQTIRCAENAYYGLRLCDEMTFHIVICAFNVKSEARFIGVVEVTSLAISSITFCWVSVS